MGGQRPARISWATALTVRDEERALSRSHSKAVASSMSWWTIRAPLACSISTRLVRATWSCSASRPLTCAWAAEPSRLATTPA
jgi:hypothetical protein